MKRTPGYGTEIGSEPVISLGNEFAEVQVRKVHTRNGSRLLISSPKSGHWISLCPLELEALTWQDQDSISRLVNNPYGPMEFDQTYG